MQAREVKAAITDSDVTFGDLTEKNIGQLRKLNEYLYPVRYQDKFYKDVLAQGEWAQYGEAHVHMKAQRPVGWQRPGLTRWTFDSLNLPPVHPFCAAPGAQNGPPSHVCALS